MVGGAWWSGLWLHVWVSSLVQAQRPRGEVEGGVRVPCGSGCRCGCRCPLASVGMRGLVQVRGGGAAGCGCAGGGHVVRWAHASAPNERGRPLPRGEPGREGSRGCGSRLRREAARCPRSHNENRRLTRRRSLLGAVVGRGKGLHLVGQCLVRVAAGSRSRESAEPERSGWRAPVREGSEPAAA